MGKVTAWRVRREFDNLPPAEKYLIMVVVERHERVFVYPPGDSTVQSLIDKRLVEYVGNTYGIGLRFQIRWDKWCAFESFRAHVRAERFTEDDEKEIERVAEAFKFIEKARRRI